jgi:hypothetical protein
MSVQVGCPVIYGRPVRQYQFSDLSVIEQPAQIPVYGPERDVRELFPCILKNLGRCHVTRGVSEYLQD